MSKEQETNGRHSHGAQTLGEDITQEELVLLARLRQLKGMPVIIVGFDATRQCAPFNLDNEEFKTWDFAIAVLRMAIDDAEQKRRLAHMIEMQRQQQEAVARAQMAARNAEELRKLGL